MSAALKRRVTPQEYLAAERLAPFKSQYYKGEVFAMAGASPAHQQIATNIVRELLSRLGKGPCQPFFNDARVGSVDSRMYSYPDIVVACEPIRHDVDYNLLNPKVIFEILSPSTETFDRTGKFDAYRALPSLTEYVLVSQDRPRVERFTRIPEEEPWKMSVFVGLDAALELSALDVSIPLADIYHRVKFAETDQASAP